MDVACVHAAKGGDVQHESGFGNAGGGGWSGGDGRGVGRVSRRDVIGAGGHAQVVGPQSCVDFNRPREDVGVAGGAGVQAQALNDDGALDDAVALQVAGRANDGSAGGEDDVARIDEGAAVDLDAGRVGD